ATRKPPEYHHPCSVAWLHLQQTREWLIIQTEREHGRRSGACCGRLRVKRIVCGQTRLSRPAPRKHVYFSRLTLRGVRDVNGTADLAGGREEGSISLLALWYVLVQGWRSLAAMTGLFTAAAIVFAFVMPPVYRAESIVTPTNVDRRDGSASALVGQLSGIAGLAGINIGNLTGRPQ